MFTLKEFKALNVLFKKFKNERPRVKDILDFLNSVGPTLNSDVKQNLALLFYFNWTPTGDFKSIENPVRVDKWDYYSQDQEVHALSEFLKDYDYSKYFNATNDDIPFIHYGEEIYIVFKNQQQIRKLLGNNTNICKDQDVIKNHIYVSSPFAVAADFAEEDVNKMSDEEIVDKSKIGDILIKLEEKIQFEENRCSKRENIENTIIERLEVAERESDSDTIKKLKDKLKELYKEINDIYGSIYSSEEEMEDVIIDARLSLIPELSDKYENMMVDDPIDFFINFKKIGTFEQLLKKHYITVNCNSALADFVEDIDNVKRYLNLENSGHIKFDGVDYTILY